MRRGAKLGLAAPVGLCALVLVVVGLANASPRVGPANSTPRVGPAGTRFYAPASRFVRGVHGSLIWRRAFHGSAGLPGAINTLLLYTQTGIHGRLVATSGFVAVPRGRPPVDGWPVVTWGHGTTGIADGCAPTRYDNAQDFGTIDPLLERWLGAGYAVVRTDYEGLGTPGTHPYLIGRSEGRAMLDAVRAARRFEHGLSNRVIITGHSQGAHAALWAASMARAYTPELRVRGVVAFAPPSHLAQVISRIRSVTSARLTGTLALLLRGAELVKSSLHIPSLLTPAAARLYPQTLTRCSVALASSGSYGGVPGDRLFQPSAHIAALQHVLGANDPGRLKIGAPILIEQGLADVSVPPAYAQALARSLSRVGDHVTYHTYPGADHGGVLSAAADDATAFMWRRFGGGLRRRPRAAG